jgi:hypothetical protein
MTPDQIKLVVDEVERRFRERTPATRVDEVNASYRVGRGEVRRWCSEQGIPLDELDEDLAVASLRLFVRLHREFPRECWDHWNAASKDLAKRYRIVLPRIKPRPVQEDVL